MSGPLVVCALWGEQVTLSVARVCVRCGRNLALSVTTAKELLRDGVVDPAFACPRDAARANGWNRRVCNHGGMASEFSFEVPEGAPPIPPGLVDAVSSEQRRLLELEELVGSLALLPEGWEWRSRLHISPSDGFWLVRATLCPELAD